MKWKPVSEKSEEIENLLSEIAEILNSYKRASDSIGLIGGSFGVALFLLYYSLMTKTDKYQNNVNNILSEIFDSINQGQCSETFCDGVAGVGWGMQHLVKQDLLEFDIQEFQHSSSNYLQQSMIECFNNKNNFDYLHGALGIGIYFLDIDTKEGEIYIKELVDFLDRISIKDGKTVKWNSEVIGVGTVYNFSLSHGIASIIAFLLKAYKKGIEKETSLKLINGGINYILSNRLDQTDSFSIFPSYIDIKGKSYKNSRLAWCYGDLGIGLALWLAADATKNKELKQEVINIFIHASKRIKLAENGVIDAGICHGAVGIAHIFSRMYNYTGVEEFKETALFWFDHALKMRTFPDGLAGYKAWYSESYGGWQSNATLLVGISGIGLALISAISDIEPDWDECLLLS